MSPALDAPPEPVDIKHRLRRYVLDQPDTWHRPAGPADALYDWLWDRWAPTLEAWGATRAQLAGVAGGYRQELWLWLMGERTWTHTAAGLAGRLRRRSAPDAAGPPG